MFTVILSSTCETATFYRQPLLTRRNCNHFTDCLQYGPLATLFQTFVLVSI